MGSSSVAATAWAFVGRRGTIGSASRSREEAETVVSDAAIVEAVGRLADERVAPSTSRVVLALAGADGVATSSLRAAVSGALERLHREARLVRSDHGGTRRWRLPG